MYVECKVDNFFFKLQEFQREMSLQKSQEQGIKRKRNDFENRSIVKYGFMISCFFCL